MAVRLEFAPSPRELGRYNLLLQLSRPAAFTCDATHYSILLLYLAYLTVLLSLAYLTALHHLVYLTVLHFSSYVISLCCILLLLTLTGRYQQPQSWHASHLEVVPHYRSRVLHPHLVNTKAAVGQHKSSSRSIIKGRQLVNTKAAVGFSSVQVTELKARVTRQ